MTIHISFTLKISGMMRVDHYP